MGSNRLCDRGETVRPVHRQCCWIGQSYSPESEISTDVRQDRRGPHTPYYPHHPTFENSEQRRESISGESTNQPRTGTRST